jgi:hypothetical protein
MPIHTLRGQFTEDVAKRLILADGQLTRGHRITKFVISGDPSSAANDVYAQLSTGETENKWNWADNRQIAWCSTNMFNVGGAMAPFTVIDPEHVVIQDLFINGNVGSTGGSGIINYLIELTPVTLTDEESVIQLIKERSQDDV